MDNFAFNLNSIWFILIFFFITGYAILDGFDLGVGILHLFTRGDNERGDNERQVMFNTIAPVWDGNLVWLVTLSAVLFGTFPVAYATILSGFYLGFMAVLMGLIFRAVSIHFRNKKEWKWWRRGWDVVFSFSSTLVSFLFGLVLGNLVLGIPLDSNYDFIGTFGSLFNPYSIFVGFTTVFIFALHGNLYLLLKTKNALYQKIRSWVKYTIFFLVLTLSATIIFSHIYIKSPFGDFLGGASYLVVLTFVLLAILYIVREFRLKREGRAFVASCFVILSLIVAYATGTYPYLVFSSLNAENSLTVYNAASSSKALAIMLVMALIGMPFVIIYSIAVYRVFRKRVDTPSDGYGSPH